MTAMQLDLGFGAPMTVSELTGRIKNSLEADFSEVWVQGEITNLRTPSSGHVYFTLKDKDAQIRAVFFKMDSRSVRFRPEDGLEVTVRGRVSVYEPRGEYQIIVSHMEPVGLGALQLAFLQLKEKLGKEGLFDTAHKRPLPVYPKRVGVVTSPTGAAFRDILKVLKRRAPGVQVLLAAASVQGDLAPAEITAAIADLNRSGGLDVIIVGRGGGSPEDLAAFNTETVARAIYNSGLPVISAVGHEVDFTIADFVADLRAPTPSAAAEIVAGSEEELKDTLARLRDRMVYSVTHGLKLYRARLEAKTRALPDIRKLVQDRILRLDEKAERLRMAMSYLMQGKRHQLEYAAVRLSALSPLAPLARGFAIARKLPELSVIKDPAQVEAGDMLRLQLMKGELECRVENKLENINHMP